jgi:hypothetical protein
MMNINGIAVRSPMEIVVYCAAILAKMDLPMNREELEAFKPLIDDHVINFILTNTNKGAD